MPTTNTSQTKLFNSLFIYICSLFLLILRLKISVNYIFFAAAPGRLLVLACLAPASGFRIGPGTAAAAGSPVAALRLLGACGFINLFGQFVAGGPDRLHD